MKRFVLAFDLDGVISKMPLNFWPEIATMVDKILYFVFSCRWLFWLFRVVNYFRKPDPVIVDFIKELISRGERRVVIISANHFSCRAVLQEWLTKIGLANVELILNSQSILPIYKWKCKMVDQLNAVLIDDNWFTVRYLEIHLGQGRAIYYCWGRREVLKDVLRLI